MVALWTANKDPKTIREWIQAGAELWLAEFDERVAGVGGLRNRSEISLLYVDPLHSRRGVGRALLARLEEELARQGSAEAHLDATATAREFYRRFGWENDGTPGDWNGIPQYPMRKSLHPAGEGLRPTDPGDMSG